MPKLALLFVLPLFSQFAMAAMDPASKESRLYEIYQTYNSGPTSSESWSQVLQAQNNIETYDVAAGDSLWDISSTLFGDGFFWSKIWSLNPYIKNPHRINTGDKIQFMMGQGLNSPGLKVADASGAAPAEAAQEAPVEVKIPPAKKRAPVPKGWPASLPTWLPNYEKMKVFSDENVVGKVRNYSDAILTLTHYVADEIPEGLGEIIETETDGIFAAKGAYVFIEGENLRVGQTYSVVKPTGEVKDPESWLTSYAILEVQGQVKVLGQIDGYFRAVVTRQVSPIEVGSILVAADLTEVNLDQGGQESSGQALVMGGEYDTRRNYMGMNTVIYLNKGSDGGLSEGQNVNIYSDKENRYKKSKVKKLQNLMARARIANVQKNCATAIIYASYGEVAPKDYIGPAGSSSGTAIDPSEGYVDTGAEEEKVSEDEKATEESLGDESALEEEMDAPADEAAETPAEEEPNKDEAAVEEAPEETPEDAGGDEFSEDADGGAPSEGTPPAEENGENLDEEFNDSDF